MGYQTSFSKKLSNFVLMRAGVARQMSLIKRFSIALALCMMVVGVLLWIYGSSEEVRAPQVGSAIPPTNSAESAVAETSTAKKDVIGGIGGALFGAGLAVFVARLLSQEEELINIVAAGMMSKSSVDQASVRAFQCEWEMFHTTRCARGIFNLHRGFVWIKASIDLRTQTPGKLLGTYRTTDPLTKVKCEYVAEGYLRQGMLVLHIFPGAGEGSEDIEATFLFPFVQRPDYVAYGSGYHMTYAGKADLAQSPAILCPVGHALADQVEDGVVSNDVRSTMLDTTWWNSHRVKTLPRIFSQISPSYAVVGDIQGSWRFRYYLVYDDTTRYAETTISITRGGARILLEPASSKPDGVGALDEDVNPTADAAVKWMAEMRPLHPFCLTGRWWGVSDARDQSDREHFDDRTPGLAISEGTMLLHVDVNDRGIYGLFAGRPGASSRVFAAVAAVRRREDGGHSAGLDRIFERANTLVMAAAASPPDVNLEQRAGL